ncbi:MAG: response regulator [Lachnospiraceae bacterium]|nr:response regulator [Lachnospiraceae bacterium]
MDNKLVWQERFNIGVDIIDREHRKLFSILNKLLAFSEQESKSQWVCEEGVKYFKEHAMRHFAEEEVYMASIGYNGFETHRRVHDNFRRKTLPELEQELLQSDYSQESVSHFLGVCAGWLIGHTLTEDRAIVGKAESRWIGLLPEEEQSRLGKTIIRLLFDMFQLDSRLLSERYGGEKFGRGIYYRLAYGNDEKKRMEILMVFEEKLISRTVGKMMGAKSDKLDTMLLNTTRYVARQFAERIREYMPEMDTYELKEENLLTYDPFKRAFDKNKLQSSLLFNTGEGYFAFCTFAPHLLIEEPDVSIRAENAMHEVEDYLSQNAREQTSKKQKILLVDDSDVILNAMGQLLGGIYQVSMVKSGLAAIRSISLNRPDLILLDYEMPVCDGRQVLEMIRSEEDFKDIPVIFLTGRIDRESIKKVMALKPAGYFSKKMQPEEIKKEIENFLSRNHKEQARIKKRKILLVDDSEVILNAMKKLLEGDYQMSLANSGLAAIRSISLNRPDLILLDYEMPICDGKQVLEMIRLEEDYKDIPVIFLTGRVDKETIDKVMELKPAGYISKSMQPEEIKQNIDEYFEKRLGSMRK